MKRRSFLISSVLITAVMALTPGFAHGKEAAPLTVDGASTVTVAQAKDLFDQGAIFIDPRGDADWDAGRIPGSIHLALKGGLTADSLAEVAGKDEPVVFYCNGVKCGVSSKACIKAVSWGFTKVYYFREGFPGWEAAGYPVE